MVGRQFLILALAGVSVQMQRKSGDGVGKQADAGINRHDLHCRALIHTLSAVRHAENEQVSGIPDVILNIRQFRRISRLIEAE